MAASKAEPSVPVSVLMFLLSMSDSGVVFELI